MTKGKKRSRDDAEMSDKSGGEFTLIALFGARLTSPRRGYFEERQKTSSWGQDDNRGSGD
jgi:hypothetical protein